jgi:glycosyltransferase involved in cell wall biosynthesis
MKLSFVYPMYDENGDIETVIRSSHRVGKAACEAFEIIVVNDCSTDGSGESVEGLKAEFPESRVIHHRQNRKLGGSLKTAFAAVTMDWVLYMDSDLPVAFEDVERVLRIVPDGVDMVSGYRLGRAKGILREAQSWGYSGVLRTLFGLRVRDVNFAFTLFRRELVAEPLQSEGSFIDAEMLLRAQMLGYDIRQAGLPYHMRKAGQSTLGSPKVIPKLLREMLAFRWKKWKGRSPVPREVIFNADDFGLCASINEGIIAGHQRGFRALQRLALLSTCRLGKLQIIRSNVLNCDDFLSVTHAGRWNVRNLHEQITSLPPGVTEICCHPRSETAAETACNWGYETREEFEALTSEDIRRALKEQKVRVTTFRERFLMPS